MDWTLEVAVVPVGDIDRAVSFYRDQLGFDLDHDQVIGGHRIAQLTPRGSGCSIAVGDLPAMRLMEPGTLKGLQLVVPDIERAHRELVERDVAVSDITVLAPDRDGGRFFWFDDPDGNGWAVQEIKARAERPLIPRS
ncbi:MAG: VOC family protein [Acidimicrobiales bacterium]|nr:VOC family protein [Acidimicrobiales bacterium]HLV90026.1 VOC family protein [Acidimicrobiia bacterium]